MGLLYNLARMTSPTTGNGSTLTLGSAVPGFLTFSQAGVVDGQTVSYGIRDGAASEVGEGVCSSGTLTRNVTKSTNGDARLSLSGSEQVYITIRSEDVNDKVAKAGDVMTGNLAIAKAGPALILNRPAVGTSAVIQSTIGGTISRWLLELGNAEAESGGNVGSNLVLQMFDDGGGYMGAALKIYRSEGGRLTLVADPTLALHAATKQYVDTKVTKAGDTMTGTLSIQLSPLVIATGAMNIGYVAPYGIMLRPDTDTGPVPIVFTNAGSTICGQISTTTTTTTYATSSDGRLKEDVKALSTAEAGSIIDNTEIYDFKWKETNERAYGVIAQQAAPVYATPMFHDEKSDRWFVDYSKYIPVVLRELQALRARVAQLEAAVAGKPLPA